MADTDAAHSAGRPAATALGDPVPGAIVVHATNCESTKTPPFEAGQVLRIGATGSWSVCRQHCAPELRGTRTGPNGFLSQRTTVGEPVADATGAMTVGGFPIEEGHRGALLAQIGDGQPFEVGPSWTVKLNEAAPLGFTINDNDCTDNDGAMAVTIEVLAGAAQVVLPLDERKRLLDRAFALGQAITGQARIGAAYAGLQYYIHTQPDLAEEKTASGVRLYLLHAVYSRAAWWDITVDATGTIRGHSQSGYEQLMHQLGVDGSGRPLPAR